MAEGGLLLLGVWPEAVAVVVGLLHVHHQFSLVLSNLFDDTLLKLLQIELILQVLLVHLRVFRRRFALELLLVLVGARLDLLLVRASV